VSPLYFLGTGLLQYATFMRKGNPMKTKTWIEAKVTNFAKSDKKREDTMFAKNVILRLSKTKNDIKCTFYKREKENNKTRKIKIYEIIPTKIRGKYKVNEDDYNKLALIIVNNNKITKADVTNKFKKYFDDFRKELESKIKNDVDVNKKALINFNKYFIFWADKTENDINERNLIDFCNYVVKNAKAAGSAVARDKSGCYAIRMSITTLRKFLSYLFLRGIIKKETLQIAKNFIYVEFFTHCKKLQSKQTAFNHFKSVEDVREFYSLILEIKDNLEDYLKGDFSGKEYIATELLKYKKGNLLTITRAQDFLYKIYVTEFLLLTGLRGIDFFRIKVKNIKWSDRHIYFEKTKNDEEYYLYLTDYLYNLAFNIYNLAQQITGKNTFIATTHSTLRNFFNTFYKQQYNFDINIHGFRHTLKTLASQYLSYSDSVIEEQIQHTKKGTDKNYMKGDLRERRLKMLEDYRLLITPLYLKYYFSQEDKERQEEKIKNEINSFFDEITTKYNISKADLMRILLKNF